LTHVIERALRAKSVDVGTVATTDQTAEESALDGHFLPGLKPVSARDPYGNGHRLATSPRIPIPKAYIAACRAAVPLLTASFVPLTGAKAFSNSAIFGPVVSQSDRERLDDRRHLLVANRLAPIRQRRLADRVPPSMASREFTAMLSDNLVQLVNG
jgi:hypothetical protein